MGRDYIAKGAILSKDKRYRYELSREWGIPLSKTTSKTRALRNLACLFIMLNPSTADADTDDPTIRRCVSFAAREGYSKLLVANLFAYRTASPQELKLARYDKDIIGPDYWNYLEQSILSSGRIIVAWGSHGKLLAQDEAVLTTLEEDKTRMPLYCFGLTSGGEPRHPLYVHGSQKLLQFSWRPVK